MAVVVWEKTERVLREIELWLQETLLLFYTKEVGAGGEYKRGVVEQPN